MRAIAHAASCSSAKSCVAMAADSKSGAPQGVVGSNPMPSALTPAANWRRSATKPLPWQGFSHFRSALPLPSADTECPSSPSEMQRICSAARFPGFFCGVGFRHRQVSHRLGLIRNSDMRVTHRHLHVGMRGQFLGFGERRPAPQQLRDGGYDAQRHESPQFPLRFIGNPRRFRSRSMAKASFFFPIRNWLSCCGISFRDYNRPTGCSPC